MTVVTVFGVATQLGGVVELRSRSGRISGGYAIDGYDLDLEEAAIDCDHDGRPVGEIAYAELGRNELAVVGVVDGRLAETSRPVYWSGSYDAPDAPHDRTRSFLIDRASVGGMSLTFNPANTTARQLRWMPGDVRSSADRSRWPLSWRSSHPLLARAVDEGGMLRTRAATRIVDRRYTDYDLAGLTPVEKIMLADEQLEAWQLRPLRYRPARIIGVR